MRRVNLLHGPRFDPLAATRDLRLTASTRTAIAALLATIIGLFAAVVVERSAFGDAVAVRAQLDERVERADRRLGDLRAHLVAIRRLTALADRAHAVQRSGSERAAAVAEIANRLPAGVWLTAIEQQPDGYDLRGEAANFAALGSTLEQLATGHRFAATTLRGAREVDSGSRPLIDFNIRLSERLPR
ncbi:MAG: PilN domain-containing protein [Vulcanimicrobiaceae bacterium]